MPELSFHLPVFEGPMDLLLHLIAKHKLNIHDIEISVLLEQYLLYMQQCAEQDYELAGEFLAMAAKLIWMKTAALLPRPEEAEAVKKELEGALIEYSVCKLAAGNLRALWLGDVLFVRKPAALPVDLTYRRTHDPSLLISVYRNMGIKKLPQGGEGNIGEKIHAVVQMHHQVTSVASKVVFLLRQFLSAESVRMADLFDGLTRKTDRVALFLAILELTKSGRTCLSDDGTVILMKNRDELLSGKRQRRRPEDSAEDSLMAL
ncbi:MAG: segregation/condensation protein A [Oscillospiraceae bacterium]|nr:segregation/condensation protein A [Oscillospiraceae bacterium]